MWRPEVCYGGEEGPTHLDSAEEGGRGSLQASSSTITEEDHEVSTPSEAVVAAAKKKAVIPHRRTPTVHIPRELKVAMPSGPLKLNTNAIGSAASSEGNTPTSRPGYRTMETKTELSLVLLEFSYQVYEKTKIVNPKTYNWCCGWKDHEYLDMQQTPKPPTTTTTTTTSSEVDRSRLHTPADGYRSTLNSRASSSRYTTSSRGGRRSYQYTFHHYDDPALHIETYRELYSYTALYTDPSQRRNDDEKLFCEGEDVEQDAEVVLPIGVKSLYRGDPHLKELVSRLGIKEPLSPEPERQQQLLHAPRPTPPSIVKRNRNERESVSIIVSNSAPKRYNYVRSETCLYRPTLMSPKRWSL